MIRENQQLFNVLNIVFDMLVLFITTLFICSPIFSKFLGTSYKFDFEALLLFFVILVPTYLALYYLFSLYTPQRTNKSIFSESYKIIQVNFCEFLLLSAASFFNIISVSEDFLIFFMIVNVVFASIERSIIRFFLRLMRSKGFNIKYVLIIGAGEVGRRLVDTINTNTYLGYKVIGFLDDSVEGNIEGVNVLGRIEDIENTLSGGNMIDRVIVSISPRHFKVLERVMASCEKMGVRADIVPDYYRYVTSHPNIELLDDIPLISVRYLPLDIFYNKIIKRTFDVVFSLISLVVLSPLFLVVAVAVKINSKGPIIYRQERVGEGGKPFIMYKFRSMYSENEYIDDKKWTQKGDTRITSVGKVIRKYSIDELPQLYNILKGDMSLIGPRPERPYLVNKFRESVPKYMIKHHVCPGMTGWAQINGYRGNTSIVKRIEYDIYYVENWSLWLDIKIFIKTLPTLLNDKNAY